MSPLSYAEKCAHSLKGNDNIPHREIMAFYPVEAWKMIKDTPYSGYVIVHGQVNKKSEFLPGKVTECYPDDSKNKLALKMAGNVKLSSATVGTRINPKADVYVIFYDGNNDDRTAIVFGKRSKSANVAMNSQRSRYMSLFSY